MRLLPISSQRRLALRIKDMLVHSNRHPVSRFVGLQAYAAMQSVIARRFDAVDGVRAVYLCHSLAGGECYPGLSDFDLAVVFVSADRLALYDRIRRVWGSLKRYFPISDLSLLTVDDFDAWQRMGGGWDPLDEVRNWKLIAGEEQRHATADLRSEIAALDRMQWAIGHFQNLLTVAIKEERQSPLMALVARRQLHKCFWNTVLPLDPRYLAISAYRERVQTWISRNGEPEPVADLQAMDDARFLRGPVSIVRFTAAALAYQLLDEALAANPLLARRLVRPVVQDEALPIANLPEVEERARTICTSVLEMLDGGVESIMLGSTGTARGYAFYIVLRDGLSPPEIASALRDLRAVHRVFDDPWFNEHFPAGIPIVGSRRMFLARLQTGRSSLHYFEKFRRVLYGADLYEEFTSRREAVSDAGSQEPSPQLHDWSRERLLYSLHLHQVYLARLKPALLDYVTFYLPRLMIRQQTGSSPATAEEAAAGYARLSGGIDRDAPIRMLREFEGKDLDAVLRTMETGRFRDVWPLLRQGLPSEVVAA